MKDHIIYWLLSKFRIFRDLVKDHYFLWRYLQDILLKELTTFEILEREGGALDVKSSVKLMEFLAGHFLKILETYPAENYVEIYLKTPAGREIVVNIRKKEGFAPDELRIQEAAKVDGLKRLLRNLHDATSDASTMELVQARTILQGIRLITAGYATPNDSGNS